MRKWTNSEKKCHLFFVLPTDWHNLRGSMVTLFFPHVVYYYFFFSSLYIVCCHFIFIYRPEIVVSNYNINDLSKMITTNDDKSLNKITYQIDDILTLCVLSTFWNSNIVYEIQIDHDCCKHTWLFDWSSPYGNNLAVEPFCTSLLFVVLISLAWMKWKSFEPDVKLLFELDLDVFVVQMLGFSELLFWLLPLLLWWWIPFGRRWWCDEFDDCRLLVSFVWLFIFTNRNY